MDRCTLLKALYNFTTAYDTTLAFSVGDYFYLYQSKTNQENWWLVVNNKGQLGFVPSTYVVKQKVSTSFYIKFIEKIIDVLEKCDTPMTKGQQKVLEQLLDQKSKLQAKLDEPNRCCPVQDTPLVDLSSNLVQFWTKAGLSSIGEIPPPIIENDQEAQYKALAALADQGSKYLRFNPVVGLKEYNDIIQTSTKQFTNSETQSEKKSMFLKLKRKLSFKKEPHYTVNEIQCQRRNIKNEWSEIGLELNTSQSGVYTGPLPHGEQIVRALNIRECDDIIRDKTSAEENQENFEKKQFAEKGVQYGRKELHFRIYEMQGYGENTFYDSYSNISGFHGKWNDTRSAGDEIQSSYEDIGKETFEKKSIRNEADSKFQTGGEMTKFNTVAAPVSMQYATGNMNGPYAIIYQEPDECEWCEFGMIILTIVLLVFVSVLNIFWALYFCGGYTWGENYIGQLNLHSTLMCIGLITFNGFSILIHRICRCVRIICMKLLHILFHVLAVPCIVIGLLATCELHSSDEPHVSHYLSLHSWLGVVTLLWFGFESLCGFLNSVMPFIPKTNQMVFLRIMGEVHAICGLLSFVLSICCCLTGLAENTLQVSRIKHVNLIQERAFVNIFGLALTILLLLFLCITLPRFRFSRVPKDDHIKKSIANS